MLAVSLISDIFVFLKAVSIHHFMCLRVVQLRSFLDSWTECVSEKESEPSKGLQTSSRPAGVHGDGPLSLPPSQQRLALPPPQPQPLPPTLTQSPHMIQPQAPTPPPPLTHPPHPTHLTHRPPPTHPPHPSLPPLLSVPPPSLHSPSTAYAQSPAGPLHFQSAPSGPHAGTHGMPPQAFLHPNQRADGLPADQGLEESQQGLDNFVFRIPPPPMPGVTFDARQYRTPHFSRKDYGFAWVPSANSAFPPGYDPRLPEKRSSDDRTHASEEGGETTNEAGAQLVPSASGAVVFHEHAQPKPKEPASKPPLPVHSGGGEKIIIKQYKPRGPPPRFVPRQVQEKKDSNSRSADANVPTECSKVKAKEDEMNREIRREAFRLGNDQGPSLPTDPEIREQLLGQRPLVEPKVEASVLTSVKAIRKRLSKVWYGWSSKLFFVFVFSGRWSFQQNPLYWHPQLFWVTLSALLQHKTCILFLNHLKGIQS